MNKIALIISREYLSRVRKKSFIIMTFVGPILMGAVFASVFLLNKVDNEIKTIAVLDQTQMFASKFKDSENLKFVFVQQPLDSLRANSKQSGYFGVLHIPAASNLPALEKSVTLYSESQPGFEVVSRIKFTLEKEINTSKYIEAGIDEQKLNKIKTDVEIKTRDLENKVTSTPLTSGLGFAGGLLIYLFIFIYGAAVMRGVLEEKTSRIVEVIVSSVKPFQLMMGKILGVALVGLTQFLLWVILTTAIYSGVMSVMFSDQSAEQRMETMIKSNPGAGASTAIMDDNGEQPNTAAMITEMMNSINIPLLIGMFIFYFLGGYLLYSAMFAAIGAASDSETDTQQFMLPVTIPLILAYVAAINVISNPQGNVAFWFSIIPLTSPIVMMVRIPFGVPWEHLVLSIVLLIGGFIFTTWLASRIYRVGILMYGKKVSYREIWKWLRYKN